MRIPGNNESGALLDRLSHQRGVGGYTRSAPARMVKKRGSVAALSISNGPPQTLNFEPFFVNIFEKKKKLF
jgi:hypothetical protein